MHFICTIRSSYIGAILRTRKFCFDSICCSDARSLLLAENLYSSAKLAAVLYLLTRLGGLCNTLSLAAFAWVIAFIVPKVRHLATATLEFYNKDDFKDRV
jgi:hypothetical protein